MLSITTYCVHLEPGLLPSTGITRLPRYYGPLHHPIAPVPSLAGVRLLVPKHVMGIRVLRALSLCTMCNARLTLVLQFSGGLDEGLPSIGPAHFGACLKSR